MRKMYYYIVNAITSFHCISIITQPNLRAIKEINNNETKVRRTLLECESEMGKIILKILTSLFLVTTKKSYKFFYKFCVNFCRPFNSTVPCGASFCPSWS